MEISLLIDKIKRDKGLDLSGYKESTLTRRIERRMQFDGAASLEEYIQIIDRDYHLYWRLVRDFFWLGTAEGLLGEALKLFEPMYKNEKIFKKV